MSSHEPTLPTILMIERAVKDAKNYPTKAQLWKSLPRKVHYATFLRVIEYLVASCKIIFDSDQTIVWVFPDNPKLDKLLDSRVTVEPPQHGRWAKKK